MITQSSSGNSDCLVLKISVESLDISNSNTFREQVTPLISVSTGIVELDCSSLGFIDSSGVGALLHANKLLPVEFRPVRLTGVDPKIMALLELMHVHRSFSLEPKK